MYSMKVNISDYSYPLYIEKGIMNNIGEEVKKIYKGNKIALITDSNVEPLYGDIVVKKLKGSGFEIKKIVIQAGEKSKSIEVLLRLYNEILDFKINRGNIIIALGGGVVGDITGFAASTLLRGIQFIQIPTTLISQVDSSIGGKVAVNLDRGKNLVGSFYHPKAVFIDPNCLQTLNSKFFSDGMAEVIKYGAIRDKSLFDKLMNYENREKLMEDIDSIIFSCCSIKKEIVEKDEKDTGERMILNFGHTLGHVIENAYNYETYTHGEGVAMGMYSISKISESYGVTEKGTTELLKDILEKYNLPCKMPDIDREKIIDTMGVDKKNLGEFMNVILLKCIGHAFIKKLNKVDICNYNLGEIYEKC